MEIRLKPRRARKIAIKPSLEALGISHFDKDIRRMTRQELLDNFAAGSSGRILVAKLIKNLIWQAHEMIQAGTTPPIKGNIRTFWYLWVKPVLSRVSLSRKLKTDPYETMLLMFTQLILDRHLCRYEDFDFTDERWENRRIGTTRPEILIFAEKNGAIRFLRELHDELGVSVLALGGQPSALTSEYTARDIKTALTDNPKIRLIGIVDYDPAGAIIAQAFKNQLAAVGMTNTTLTTLIHPKHYSPEEIEMFRYKLPKGESTKLARWLEETGGINGEPYGLEAESMPVERLRGLIDKMIGTQEQLNRPAKKQVLRKAR